MRISRPARMVLFAIIIGSTCHSRLEGFQFQECRAAEASGMQTIRPELAVIFNPSADPRRRFDAVHSLGYAVNEAEITALLQFLESKPDVREKNLSALEFIKNDLVVVLLRQKPAAGRLVDILIRMCRDLQQDLVTRDYSVQHLVSWYEQQDADTASEIKSKVREELSRVAKTETSMAGTALLGLHHLARIDREIDFAQIRRRAVEMVGSASELLPVRVTAVQVCAEEGAVEALTTIRSLAFSNSPTVLRISAIAALGQLGSEQDIISLENLASTTPDDPIYPAVHGALKQLQQKIHPQKLALNQD